MCDFLISLRGSCGWMTPPSACISESNSSASRGNAKFAWVAQEGEMPGSGSGRGGAITCLVVDWLNTRDGTSYQSLTVLLLKWARDSPAARVWWTSTPCFLLLVCAFASQRESRSASHWISFLLENREKQKAWGLGDRGRRAICGRIVWW